MKYGIEIGNHRFEVDSDVLAQGQYRDDNSGLSYCIWRIVGWKDFEQHLLRRFSNDPDAAAALVEMFFSLAQASGLAKYVFEEAVEKLCPAFGDSIDEIRKDARRIERARRDAQYE